jgi:hypothetical protein
LMLAGGAISWRSRSHKSVVLSTAAAEYYEGSEACREVAFIRSIMEDFNECNLDPTPLLIDNQAAICMSKLPQCGYLMTVWYIVISHLTYTLRARGVSSIE